MKIEWVTVGPFQENSYLLWDERSRHGVLVDPGDEPAAILRMVRSAGVTIDAIWLTHGHLDHIGAIAGVTREWDVPVTLHEADVVLYRRGAQQATFYGLPFEQPADPTGRWRDGEEVRVGETRFTVKHLPGHSPGHVVFLSDDVMIGGDLLFAGSIGRTDLPMSNPEDMETSLAAIATLDPAIVVYPGHGPPTSIGAELMTNPYLSGTIHDVRIPD